MKIKNQSAAPLGLPGLTIGAGDTRSVPNWDAIKDNAIVSAWVKAKLLVVVSGPVSDPAKATVNEEKDALIAALAERGIYRTRRNSVESLRSTLEYVTA